MYRTKLKAEISSDYPETVLIHSLLVERVR